MKSDKTLWVHSVIGLLLALTWALAALPQPARAATCARYHLVRAGDTTASIAHTYKLKWREIAQANNLVYPYNLKVGQRLCIPTTSTTSAAATAADRLKMNVRATGHTLTITVTSSEKAAFYVRVRDAGVGVGGWYKLGILRAKKNTSTSASFSLPRPLWDKLYLQVCLKNGTTDELACRTVIQP
jgi:hypothetical protein